MPLSKDEKAAGRAFRDARQAILDVLNAESPPGVRALVYWRVVRHECKAQRGASVGITLREHYEESPEYWLCACGRISTWAPPEFPHGDCEGGARVVLAAGQLAFIWKEGTCSGAECGLTVRTALGRIVVTADRPADRERTRIERREAGAHP